MKIFRDGIKRLRLSKQKQAKKQMTQTATVVIILGGFVAVTGLERLLWRNQSPKGTMQDYIYAEKKKKKSLPCLANIGKILNCISDLTMYLSEPLQLD